jgi:hypothetical protein
LAQGLGSMAIMGGGIMATMAVASTDEDETGMTSGAEKSASTAVSEARTTGAGEGKRIAAIETSFVAAGAATSTATVVATSVAAGAATGTVAEAAALMERDTGKRLIRQ